MNKFTVGQVLSVLSGKMLVPSFGDIYAILNHMTGSSLYTHELPDARDECAPDLRRQFPDLAEIDASGITRENVEPWMMANADILAREVEVAPLASSATGRKNPIESLFDVLDRAGR